MTEKKDTWQLIEEQQKKFNSLKLSDMIDYEKYYIYSIIAHSTAIEGSTLSEKDTQLLLDEGITKKGTIQEHFMNLDLKNAYALAIEEAKKKSPITPDLLKNLNSLILKNTGSIMSVPAGTFDASKGEYRLCDVTAGIGGKSYMNYQKVPDKVDQLCDELNKRITEAKRMKDIYNLSFDAHFNLVTIHPWIDGNGRSSRLLMNYIQFYHRVTPTKVYKEDKANYIDALQKSRDNETLSPFREFMAKQHLKNLQQEIRNYEQSQKKSNGFKLMF